MDNFDRAQRDYENPPDEEEAIFCEDCGQEVEYRLYDIVATKFIKDSFRCTNVMCPSKFNGGEVALDMAVLIVEQKESIESLQNTLKYVRSVLSSTQSVLGEREATIEKLEKKITALEFRRDEGE
jgi:hypothetical protein